MRDETLHPELLPPETGPASTLAKRADEHLNYVATLLDDMFGIPGTKIRFGLDALIGWIPGIGDALAAFASCIIIVAAWQRGIAGITLVRMLCNVAFENLVGAIPIIGDLAHVAWKSNRRNYNLLIREEQRSPKHTWQDWLFVLAFIVMMAALFVGPFILLVHIMRSHRW